jgi:hypothetical protein
MDSVVFLEAVVSPDLVLGIFSIIMLVKVTMDLRFNNIRAQGLKELKEVSGQILGLQETVDPEALVLLQSLHLKCLQSKWQSSHPHKAEEEPLLSSQSLE